MNIWREDNEKAARLEQQHIELVEKNIWCIFAHELYSSVAKSEWGILKNKCRSCGI